MFFFQYFKDAIPWFSGLSNIWHEICFNSYLFFCIGNALFSMLLSKFSLHLWFLAVRIWHDMSEMLLHLSLSEYLNKPDSMSYTPLKMPIVSRNLGYWLILRTKLSNGFKVQLNLLFCTILGFFSLLGWHLHFFFSFFFFSLFHSRWKQNNNFFGVWLLLLNIVCEIYTCYFS